MRDTTDLQSREETALAAARALFKAGHLTKQFAGRLRLVGDYGKQYVVAVLYQDGERVRVVKYRANSGRWTKPLWVKLSEMRFPDPKEKRYRDALASLVEAG